MLCGRAVWAPLRLTSTRCHSTLPRRASANGSTPSLRNAVERHEGEPWTSRSPTYAKPKAPDLRPQGRGQRYVPRRIRQ